LQQTTIHFITSYHCRHDTHHDSHSILFYYTWNSWISPTNSTIEEHKTFTAHLSIHANHAWNHITNPFHSESVIFIYHMLYFVNVTLNSDSRSQCVIMYLADIPYASNENMYMKLLCYNSKRITINICTHVSHKRLQIWRQNMQQLNWAIQYEHV